MDCPQEYKEEFELAFAHIQQFSENVQTELLNANKADQQSFLQNITFKLSITQIYDGFIELYNKIKSALSEHKDHLVEFLSGYQQKEKSILKTITSLK